MTWNNFAKTKRLQPIILIQCSANMLTEMEFFPQQNYTFEFLQYKNYSIGCFWSAIANTRLSLNYLKSTSFLPQGVKDEYRRICNFCWHKVFLAFTTCLSTTVCIAFTGKSTKNDIFTVTILLRMKWFLLVSSCCSEFGSRAFLPFIKNLDLFHKRHQSQSNLRWFLLFYECLHASL